MSDQLKVALYESYWRQAAAIAGDLGPQEGELKVRLFREMDNVCSKPENAQTNLLPVFTQATVNVVQALRKQTKVKTQESGKIERGAVYYVTSDTPLLDRPLSEGFQSRSKVVLTRGTRIEVGAQTAGCEEISASTQRCRWQVVVYPSQFNGLWIQVSRLCNPHIHGFRNCPFTAP